MRKVYVKSKKSIKKKVGKSLPLAKTKKVLHIKKILVKRKISRVVIVLSFVLSVVISGLFFASMYYLHKQNLNIPTPDKVFPYVELATEIYDRTGVRLYRLFSDTSNNDKVEIKEIPDRLKAAFIAAEDSEFYNHSGFNPEAIIRCVVHIVSDKKECGASTITQQLIKITTKQSQNSIERKINEILLAMKVEEEYSKDEILEMYLRVTPYGGNISGIKTAAKFYFGVTDLKKLTLAQSAILAAIVNNPSRLSPTISANPEESKSKLEERKNYVLDQLSSKNKEINRQLKINNGDEYVEDIITQEMIDAARSEEIAYQPPIITDIKAGHFVNYAIDILQKKNYKDDKTTPFTLSELKTMGLKIYTSLDYTLQQTAEYYVNQGGHNYKFWNMYNSALMTAVPHTGEILTMVGSRSFSEGSEACDGEGKNCKFDPQVNILTTPQSPGSTNKSLGYYLAFKNSNLFPGSSLPDIPIRIGDYQPRNWDGQFMGYAGMTARQMLRESRNIPALEVVSMVGVDNYINTAREFGYTTYKDNSSYGASVILGGADVNYVDHVQAYSVFANGGDYVDLNPILKIEDRDGNIIYEAKPERKPLADKQATWLLNQTLYRLDSLGSISYWDDRPMAAKTGTSENNKDAMVIMYSPDFVTFGWGGNNNNDPMDPNNAWPGYVVNPWVKQYMKDISSAPYFANKTAFQQPDGVYWGGGDCDAYGNCLGLRPDWLIAGREPQRGDVSWRLSFQGGMFQYYRAPVAEFQPYLDRYVWGQTSL